MLVDIGINLTNTRFDKDRDLVISRALEADVVKLLITGTCEKSSEQALNLCQQFPAVLSTTVGVHPHDADNVSERYIEKLTSLAQSPSAKAIGECGLDYNRNFSTPENQRRVFQQQVELAANLSMPLFLHQRDAFDDWLDILTPYVDKVPAMVTHCFTGNKSQLLQCLDMGMYVGITGWLCDKKRGQELRDIVKYIPLDRLMVETDGPYLTPQNIKPKPKSSRNEPMYLPYIIEMLTECMGYSKQEIIDCSYQNSIKVFTLND